MLADPSSSLIPPTGGGHAGFTVDAPAPAAVTGAAVRARTDAALRARAAGDAGPLFDLGEWRSKLDTPSDADRGLYYREAVPAEPVAAAAPTAAPSAPSAPSPATAPAALAAGRLPAALGVTVNPTPPANVTVTSFQTDLRQLPRTRPRAALCAGAGLALLVSDDVSIFDADGALLAGPTPVAAFLGRPDGRDYVGAARCVRDGSASGDGRWFVVGLRGRAPNDGRAKAGSAIAQVVMATSVTEDPLGEWTGPFVVDVDGVDRVTGDTTAPLPNAPPCASTGGCSARGLTVGQDAATIWATVDLYGVPGVDGLASALAVGVAEPRAWCRWRSPRCGRAVWLH